MSNFNSRDLMPGQLTPGTSLRYVQSISKRRAEFECYCGKTKVYWLSDVESGRRKSCGCGIHKKLYIQDDECYRYVDTLGKYPYPRMSFAVVLDNIDISRELEILGIKRGGIKQWPS